MFIYSKILKQLNSSRVYHQVLGFIKTPDLLFSSSFSGFKPFILPSLNDEEIKGMINTLTLPTKLVMGKRMEHFFKEIITKSSKIDLIAHNIQLHRKKTTLGELDFLIKDLIQNKILHVELMYKIYVYDPNLPSELARWIGPNRKDSLIEKLGRVIKHQLPLLFSPEAQEYLNTLQISTKEIDQQICFKAKLFIPKNLASHQYPNVNNNCIVGFYYDLAQFKAEISAAHKFYAPEKQDWPSDPRNNTNWVSFSEINIEIQKMHLHNKSPLIWICTPTGEFESAIVVWW